jgi:hypothetical protein
MSARWFSIYLRLAIVGVLVSVWSQVLAFAAAP